jgi:hypothetical protein
LDAPASSKAEATQLKVCQRTEQQQQQQQQHDARPLLCRTLLGTPCRVAAVSLRVTSVTWDHQLELQTQHCSGYPLISVDTTPPQDSPQTYLAAASSSAPAQSHPGQPYPQLLLQVLLLKLVVVM